MEPSHAPAKEHIPFHPAFLDMWHSRTGRTSRLRSRNTYKDTLAHYRIAQRGKAVSIDLRVMVSEGFLSENKFPLQRMLDSGPHVPLKQTEPFALPDYLCDPELDTLTTQTCQTVWVSRPLRACAQKGLKRRFGCAHLYFAICIRSIAIRSSRWETPKTSSIIEVCLQAPALFLRPVPSFCRL